MPIIEGFCSTPHLDNQRHVVELGALAPLPGHVPLLYRHDASKVAGTIELLEYRDGGLWCQARIDDEQYLKGMTHLSACFTVFEHKFVDQYTEKQRRVISKARLDEISLTNNPGNSACTIIIKQADGIGPFHEALIAKVNKMRELTQCLASIQR
ncbi:prohead serine protease [Mesorhizobium albiziae]|uniref:Prohead serine protease n=1 Tax=Neomesorhizobium albiziae TaxID=335020 RepID=A0A1I3VEZ0_9HYPH|nr:HK97 family phage prohead protease [Mesorhizobium albiziae]GLS28859.1 hypothetical protein GCM10007937_05660 [Mesorhizobium albiziae]SFJ93710.1 prohead serine protease [Mesorhizobium albiziae]